VDQVPSGWCRYKNQTCENLLKHCSEWKRQQEVLWVEVRNVTGRGKDRFKIQDLFADERCSQAILDFRATTQVGRRVLDPAEEDALSEASERELGEGWGKEVEG
jgi:hypothetical protein